MTNNNGPMVTLKLFYIYDVVRVETMPSAEYPAFIRLRSKADCFSAITS